MMTGDNARKLRQELDRTLEELDALAAAHSMDHELTFAPPGEKRKLMTRINRLQILLASFEQSLLKC